MTVPYMSEGQEGAGGGRREKDGKKKKRTEVGGQEVGVGGRGEGRGAEEE